MKIIPHHFKKIREFPFLLSIVFLLFSCFVFIFLYKGINNNRNETQQLQTELQAEEAKRMEINSLENSIKNIGEDKDLLESHFIKSSNVVPFLNTLERLAINAGLKPEVTSVDISKDKSNLLVLLKTTGEFSATYKFLLLLENSPYEIELSSVDMRNLDTQNASGNTVFSSQWKTSFKIKLLSFID